MITVKSEMWLLVDSGLTEGAGEKNSLKSGKCSASAVSNRVATSPMWPFN